jgi:spore coat protein U-like protein
MGTPVVRGKRRAHVGTVIAVIGLLTLSQPEPLLASGTATANLSVSATVISTCTVTAGVLAFGNYDPTSAGNLDQSGTFAVACTKGTGATVGLDLGQNASGSTRRMISGSEYLSYELYKETARTNVWGNSGSALVTLAAASSVAAQTLTVYGRVTSGQSISTGVFLDTVTITVTF